MGAVQSAEQQEQAFSEADSDGNGAITLLEYEKVFADFMAAVGGNADEVDPKMVLENFQQYDADRSGGVSMAEWKAALQENVAKEAKGEL